MGEEVTSLHKTFIFVFTWNAIEEEGGHQVVHRVGHGKLAGKPEVQFNKGPPYFVKEVVHPLAPGEKGEEKRSRRKRREPHYE